MKRILAMMTAALIVASMMAVTAFAADDEGTVCDPSEVHGGEKVTIDTYYFVYTDKDGTEYRLDDSLDVDYYSKVTPTWKKNGSMVEQVYYNDGDSYVTLVIKAGINTSVSKNIIGQLKIRDTEARRNYVCKIEEGDLVVKGIDEKENMYEDGDKEFSLPWDYQTKKVRFVTDDGAKYGTFTAEFDNDEGDHIAKFVTKVVDQSALYLGFNETENIALMKKFPDANMRFINWTRPKFELKGKLSIYMESDEYIYGINTDDTLYRLGGTWDSDNDAYVISTDTLGSYVISDTQLVKTGQQHCSQAQQHYPQAQQQCGPAALLQRGPAPFLQCGASPLLQPARPGVQQLRACPGILRAPRCGRRCPGPGAQPAGQHHPR